MSGDGAFFLGGALAHDNVAEGPAVWKPSQASCLVFPQTVTDFHAGQERLPQEAPRFVASTRQRRHAGELVFSVLGPVASAQGLYEADQLAPKLQPAFYESCEDNL